MGITLQVNEIAFTIGSKPIYWYGIIIATGLILAILYTMKSCKKFHVNSDHLIDCILVGVIGGVIGARAYYVIFYPGDKYIKDPSQIFRIWEGGLGIYGGIIVGLLCGALMAKHHKMSVPAVLDLASMGFLIGQGIGRWGNFMNQEAHGGPMSANAQQVLSVILPNFIYNNMIIDGVVYHPTFLYESLWNFVGLILLLIIRRKRIFKVGDMMGLYLMWYGLGRGLLIEPFRTDPLLFVESAGMGNIFNRVNVVFSLTLFLIGGLLYIIVKNKIKPDIPYYYDVVLENKEEALYLLSKEGRQKRREEKNK
jgi:phosphatidylglycerol:prolipoprotein diacylglycerol transferase